MSSNKVPPVINPYMKSSSKQQHVTAPVPTTTTPPQITQEEAEAVVADLSGDQAFDTLDAKAKETKRNYSKSIVAYNKFATIQKLPLYAALSTIFLNTYDLKKLMSQFSTYLFNCNYAPLVGPNYLSSFKMQIEERYPDLNLFHRSHFNRNNQLKWYSNLYHGLKNKGANRNLMAGKSLTGRPSPIGRDLANRIALAYMKENTPDSIFQSVLVALVRSAVGRPNEVSLCTWNDLYFNGREMILQWRQKKSHLESPLSMTPDKEMMALDPYHALGRYLITYNGTFTLEDDPEIRWMFPALVGLGEQQIARKMTKAMHDLAKKKVVVGLTEAHTAYGLRHGAVDDMIFADTALGLACIIGRGGWGVKNYQTQMPTTGAIGNWIHYVSFNREQLEGSLVLQGFPHTKKCPEAPTIKAFATNTNMAAIETLTSSLFSQHDNEMLHDTGIHRSLAHTMLAAQLMYFKAQEKLHLPNQKNLVTQTIINEAYDAGISKTQLYEWGDKVWDRFLLSVCRAHDLDTVKGTLEKSIAAINSNVLSRELLAKLNLKVDDVGDQLKEQLEVQKQSNEELKSQVTMLKDEVQQLTNIIRGIVGEKVASLTVNTSTNAALSPASSPSSAQPKENLQGAATLKKTVNDDDTDAFDKLKDAQRRITKDLDRTRFNDGHPNLMTTDQFAAKVMIHDINLRIPKISPFSFPITGQMKTKLNKVYDEVRKFLTEEEKQIKPSDIDKKNVGPIFEMFATAQLKMVRSLYERLEAEDKNWKRPQGPITNEHLKVGTVVTKIQDLNKLINKRLEAAGQKKKRRRVSTQK